MTATTSPTTLLDAPADIIESIANHLDLSSLKVLRLISHDFHDLFSSIALRNVAFRINGSEEDVPRLLEACSKPLTGLYRYGRHLTVHTNGWYVARYVDEEGIQGLYKTIEQFRNLTSFKMEWQSGYDDKEETTVRVHEIQERVVEAVHKATEGKLDRLIILPWNQKGYDFPQQLKEFKGLRELEFTLHQYGWGCRRLNRFGDSPTQDDWNEPHECIPQSYRDALRSIVCNNPELEAFKLKQGCAINSHDASKLFIHDDGHGKILALRTLSMRGVRFPNIIEAQHSPFAYLRHLEVLTQYNILPLDNLWKSLEVVGAALETLETHQVTLPLCSYLASYSGLRRLTIRDLGDESECVDPRVTTSFFNSSLSRHAASLTTLHVSFRVDVDYLDGWSFTPKLWMPALQSLTALRSLHLYPGQEARFNFAELEQGGVQVERQGSGDEGERRSNRGSKTGRRLKARLLPLIQNYQEVLDHVGSLDQLQILEIIWPDETWGCGTGYMGWLNQSTKDISEVAQELRSSSGVPKELVLLSGRYSARKVKGDEDEDEWHFVAHADTQGEQTYM
ncbi:hypothetical protein AX16_007824 [Volvariella volvacea WC 439]|nr:hypothetical protein AX16_007824 [Volvariella volvacea WC 439]